MNTDSKLLEFVSTTTIHASTEKFIAKDKFVVDTSRKAKVRISYLGDNFKNWFLDKIEDSKPETKVDCRKLKKSSVDKPIITELGGEAKAETSLSEIFTLMEKQPNGENGTLLTNSYANIFYVKDINNGLRAVFVLWGGDGWYVSTESVEDPDGWSDCYYVFSRNS